MQETTKSVSNGAIVSVVQGLFSVDVWECPQALLDNARATARALVRLVLRVGGEISPEELAMINSDTNATDEEKTALIEDTKRLKSRPVSQLVRLEDVGITNYPKPPLNATGAADTTNWVYLDAPTLAALNAKKRFIASVFTASISDLLKGTQFESGVGEHGEIVPITGVTSNDRVYATHNRVYFGLTDDAETAYNTLRNGLLRDVSEGTSELGANDTERAAIVRKMQAAMRV